MIQTSVYFIRVYTVYRNSWIGKVYNLIYHHRQTSIIIHHQGHWTSNIPSARITVLLIPAREHVTPGCSVSSRHLF